MHKVSKKKNVATESLPSDIAYKLNYALQLFMHSSVKVVTC